MERKSYDDGYIGRLLSVKQMNTVVTEDKIEGKLPKVCTLGNIMTDFCYVDESGSYRVFINNYLMHVNRRMICRGYRIFVSGCKWEYEDGINGRVA